MSVVDDLREWSKSIPMTEDQRSDFENLLEEVRVADDRRAEGAFYSGAVMGAQAIERQIAEQMRKTVKSVAPDASTGIENALCQSISIWADVLEGMK